VVLFNIEKLAYKYGFSQPSAEFLTAAVSQPFDLRRLKPQPSRQSVDFRGEKPHAIRNEKCGCLQPPR
jgi:hypothetical protein